MDQDSGQKAGRSMPRRENGAGPRHRLAARPPLGAANPLPRRSAQGHIEPQLRTPGGAGTGTPFTPFGPDSDPAPDACAAPGTSAGTASRTDGTAGPGRGEAASSTDGTASPGGGEAASSTDGAGSPSGTCGEASPSDAADTSAAVDFRKGARRGRRTKPPAV